MVQKKANYPVNSPADVRGEWPATKTEVHDYLLQPSHAEKLILMHNMLTLDGNFTIEDGQLCQVW